MEFSLNQEQIILKNEVRRFLQNECPLDFVKEMIMDEKGYSPALWKKMADLGWMGVWLEEKYGGSGGTFFDLSIILEEMGRFLLPSPFFSTVILGGVTITKWGDEALKKRFLPQIASGDTIMTMALSEREDSYNIDVCESKAEPKADGYVLQGKKIFVPNAHVANYIIFPSKTYENGYSDGISLFIVEKKSEGIEIIPLISLNLERQFEVSFKDVHVSKEDLIGKQGEGGNMIKGLWPIALSGRCCEMLGAMQRVFEITLDYVQKRRQFDRPLSAFQVIQHDCADMAIDIECSKLITYQAAWRISSGLRSDKEVAMAKAWTSDALKRITTMAHQIHGGIGFTEDQNLYLYFRYAKAKEVEFGDANFHKEIVAREMD